MRKGNYKTNAVRLLEQAKIPHKLHFYPVDESDLSATHVCNTLGINYCQVYKTIVLASSNNDYVVAVIPADKEVDLKKIAAIIGVKKVSPLPLKSLQSVTGYIRGGCSPIGLKKPLPIYIQEDSLSELTMYVSGGKRGVQIEIKPQDLIAFTNATVCDLIED